MATEFFIGTRIQEESDIQVHDVMQSGNLESSAPVIAVPLCLAEINVLFTEPSLAVAASV